MISYLGVAWNFRNFLDCCEQLPMLLLFIYLFISFKQVYMLMRYWVCVLIWDSLFICVEQFSIPNQTGGYDGLIDFVTSNQVTNNLSQHWIHLLFLNPLFLNLHSRLICMRYTIPTNNPWSVDQKRLQPEVGQVLHMVGLIWAYIW